MSGRRQRRYERVDVFLSVQAGIARRASLGVLEEVAPPVLLSGSSRRVLNLGRPVPAPVLTRIKARRVGCNRLAGIMSHQILVLDVREDIRSGAAPCSRIMESAGGLEEGDTLQLIAPFEPTPLYEVLGREGFVHESREIGGGDWEVRFTKKSTLAAVQLPASASRPSHTGGGCGCGCNDVIEIDVRGLEPPQPMVRILEAIATLPEGSTLRALTDRRPVHLFDQLEARGFSGESKEDPQGGYITFIRPRSGA